MKKQIKKLSLNKKTISNLTASEMTKHVGGASTGCTDTCQRLCHGHTKPNQKTCPGYNTCY